jgi:thioredoxin reductase
VSIERGEIVMSTYKSVVIGTGPSGLTAAIYLARANLSPLVIEGPEPGGQLTTTGRLDIEPIPPTSLTASIIPFFKKEHYSNFN